MSTISDLNAPIKKTRLGMWAIASIIFFLVVSIGGNETGIMENNACYAVLGCNIGFWGYDAAVHFTSGILAVLTFLWVMSLYPSWHILNNVFWKNVFILVLFTALVAVLWEVGEFLGDYIKTHWFRIDIFEPNRMYQPSSSDTAGDMTFCLLGGLLAAVVSRIYHKMHQYADGGRLS